MSNISSNFSHTIIEDVRSTLPREGGKDRIQLFGTTEKIHAVACESITGETASLWQKFRLMTGGLVEHKITIINGKEPQTQTILLNTASLAKRLGISHKQLESLNEIEKLKGELEKFGALAQDPRAQKIQRELTQKQAQASVLPQLLDVQVKLASTLAIALGSIHSPDKEEAFFKVMKGSVNQIDPKNISSVFTAVRSFEGATIGDQTIRVEIQDDQELGKGGFGKVNTQKLMVSVAGKTHDIAIKGLALKTITETHGKKAERAFEDLKNEQRILQILSNSASEMTGIQEQPHKVSSGLRGLSNGLLMPRYEGDLRHAKVEEKHHKSMIRQLLTGLATLHKNNIIHGDIKPNNILVKDLDTQNPKFHIADFGGCKTKEEHEEAFEDAYNRIITASEENLLESAADDLKGLRTHKYDPDETNTQDNKEYISPQVLALANNDFEEWFAARQKADCFAMALSLKENLGSPTPKAYEPILLQMSNGQLTAEKALAAFEKEWAKEV